MNKKRIMLITSSILLLSVFVAFSLNEPNFFINNHNQSEKDTVTTNPKIDIKVEKEYDDEGNIIRYDSSYTYIYTYPDGNTEKLNMDSIFQNFEPYFFNHGFDIMHDPFKEFFQEDTLYQHHFFDDNFFMQQFENNMFKFEDMIREMDSLRNQFLRDMYPDIEQPEPQPKKEKTKGVKL
jgi:hypothetical protein